MLQVAGLSEGGGSERIVSGGFITEMGKVFI